MDEKQSRNALEKLLKAMSAEEVQGVLKDPELSFFFDNSANWVPYANREKNWDIVGNQQSKAVGALVELITNGIDAILLRKARESGVSDPRSPKAPQSMQEAVKRFYPHVNQGRIGQLSARQRTELAQECVLIGVKRADRKNGTCPTYTVVDFGEGQPPEAFSKTFLSLGEKNKEGIPFVQGKFNMGSSGSLRFCTRSEISLGHYKLIVSRRPGHQYWGWTLVRIREAREGESLPVAEYFAPHNLQVPRFRAPNIRAFGDKSQEGVGIIESGTAIRLYEFDIGGGGHAVDIGLNNVLSLNLIEAALPVRLFDFDATPTEGKGDRRKMGIADRTFSGLNVALSAGESDDSDGSNRAPSAHKEQEWHKTIDTIRHPKLGTIVVNATGLHKMRDAISKQTARVFYTVNGQTHATENRGFISNRCRLGDLTNNLIVNVVCDGLNKTAMTTIFMPNRETKADNIDSRELENLVIDALKGDSSLREYADEIRKRRTEEYAKETEQSKDFLDELLKHDPNLKNLLGFGSLVSEQKQQKSRQPSQTFDGKTFPSFLTALNLREENGVLVKEVPKGSSRRIHCATDAANDYLSRVNSPGRTWVSASLEKFRTSMKLHDGDFSVTIEAPLDATIGDRIPVEFGFIDDGSNINPLKVSLEVLITKAEEKRVNPPGKKKKGVDDAETNSLALPQIVWVKEESWSEHNFDEASGAYVSLSDKAAVVYVNQAHAYLKKMRLQTKNEGDRENAEFKFRYGLGLFALAIKRRMMDENERREKNKEQMLDDDDVVRSATSGMAYMIVPVMDKLSGQEIIHDS